MSGRARQHLTSDLIITETILREESVAANSQNTFSITADLDNDVTITIIEQIKRSDMAIKWKKEILRTREIFWQSGLDTLRPNSEEDGLKFRVECAFL